jgi:hypothetical protein
VFTASKSPSAFTLFSLALSALSFSGATLCCVSAFKAGSEIIMGLLTNEDANAENADRELARLKTMQYGFFIWGLVLLLVAAFSHSAQLL